MNGNIDWCIDRSDYLSRCSVVGEDIWGLLGWWIKPLDKGL